MCSAAAPAGSPMISPDSSNCSTPSMKRYPRLGRVSIKCGSSAESPSACRNLLRAIIEAFVEIDKGLVRPKPLPKRFPRYQFPRPLKQRRGATKCGSDFWRGGNRYGVAHFCTVRGGCSTTGRRSRSFVESHPSRKERLSVAEENSRAAENGSGICPGPAPGFGSWQYRLCIRQSRGRVSPRREVRKVGSNPGTHRCP